MIMSMVQVLNGAEDAPDTDGEGAGMRGGAVLGGAAGDVASPSRSASMS